MPYLNPNSETLTCQSQTGITSWSTSRKSILIPMKMRLSVITIIVGLITRCAQRLIYKRRVSSWLWVTIKAMGTLLTSSFPLKISCNSKINLAKDVTSHSIVFHKPQISLKVPTSGIWVTTSARITSPYWITHHLKKLRTRYQTILALPNVLALV